MQEGNSSTPFGWSPRSIPARCFPRSSESVPRPGPRERRGPLRQGTREKLPILKNQSRMGLRRLGQRIVPFSGASPCSVRAVLVRSKRSCSAGDRAGARRLRHARRARQERQPYHAPKKLLNWCWGKHHFHSHRVFRHCSTSVPISLRSFNRGSARDSGVRSSSGGRRVHGDGLRSGCAVNRSYAMILS